MNTAQLVTGREKVVGSRMTTREELTVGNLFRRVNGRRILMATGTRTAPPSAAGTKVPAGNIRTTNAGKSIVGYNSIVVDDTDRKIKAGEDGAEVSYDARAQVEHVGHATITLYLF